MMDVSQTTPALVASRYLLVRFACGMLTFDQELRHYFWGNMKLTVAMVDLLNELHRIEPARNNRGLSVPDSKLGNALIRHYYTTDNLLSREIIKEIMSHAGFVWLRKLIMKNPQPLDTVSHFSSLNDYIELAAANDPVSQWGSVDYRLATPSPSSGLNLD